MIKNSYLNYRLFIKAFSNKTRFEIIALLIKGPKNVTQICKELGYEQSKISHNLKCLVDCGFVNNRYDGKNKVYSLDKKHMLPILKNIDEHIKTYNKRLKVCGVLKK